jgi:deoxyuridine 5'-triphosphate nucleotidohydrolase
MSYEVKVDSPFLEDVKGLSKGSHKQIKATCQLKLSENCRGEFVQEYRTIKRLMDGNNGVYMCLQCSRRAKSSGRDNPNCKYTTLDDNYFSNVDTEAKAYLLGWIASDGHVAVTNTIKIEVEKRDREIITILRNSICPELPITERFNGSMDAVGFSFNSHKMTEDICKLLHINPGKKSDIVQFPDLATDELKWAFVRGLFDGDGSIRKFTDVRLSRECGIASTSPLMKTSLGEFCKIKHHIDDGHITFTGINSVDFLGKIYDNADARFRLNRKYNLYLEYLGFSPGLPGAYGKIPRCKYVKTIENAIAPSKNSVSDEGYDLWVIAVDKVISKDTIRFETGIKIQPEEGWHIEILPRSSLSNTGWMLANSVGLIDSSYRGTLKVALNRVDMNAKNIELPFKGVQMVLRPNVHFICDEEEELDETVRGDGGFGSTDKPQQ